MNASCLAVPSLVPGRAVKIRVTWTPSSSLIDSLHFGTAFLTLGRKIKSQTVKSAGASSGMLVLYSEKYATAAPRSHNQEERICLVASELPANSCEIVVDRWCNSLVDVPSSMCHFLCLTERSEEHTSELQSLLRISYAVFCLKKKTINLVTTLLKLISPITY